jgi:hypothetical protein
LLVAPLSERIRDRYVCGASCVRRTGLTLWDTAWEPCVVAVALVSGHPMRLREVGVPIAL